MLVTSFWSTLATNEAEYWPLQALPHTSTPTCACSTKETWSVILNRAHQNDPRVEMLVPARLIGVRPGRVFSRRVGCLLKPMYRSYGAIEHRRQYSSPSTFSKLDVAENAPVVDGYLSHGFIIRGSLVRGSVALLPRAMLNWKVS